MAHDEPIRPPATWQPPRKAPVPFGPESDQTVPHEWAGRMLTQLAAESPRTFDKLLATAARNGITKE